MTTGNGNQTLRQKPQNQVAPVADQKPKTIADYLQAMTPEIAKAVPKHVTPVMLTSLFFPNIADIKKAIDELNSDLRHKQDKPQMLERGQTKAEVRENLERMQKHIAEFREDGAGWPVKGARKRWISQSIASMATER